MTACAMMQEKGPWALGRNVRFAIKRIRGEFRALDLTFGRELLRLRVLLEEGRLKSLQRTGMRQVRYAGLTLCGRSASILRQISYVGGFPTASISSQDAAVRCCSAQHGATSELQQFGAQAAGEAFSGNALCCSYTCKSGAVTESFQ